MSETSFKIGDVVTYKTLDLENYSRGYGVVFETKGSTIISICYRLANGDIVEQNELVLAQSKSEEPKNNQNGPIGSTG